MLEQWGLTPIDLGLESWEEVDPWWGEAMMEIKSGVNEGRKSSGRGLLDSKGRRL